MACVAMLGGTVAVSAADVSAVTSSRDGKGVWQQQKLRLENRPSQTPALVIDPESLPEGWPEFRHWGMTFNELDYDALSALPEESRKEVMHRLFAIGDSASIGFTRGRVSPGANDYARSWYSCDEVPGDFQLRYFNIDRDRESIIPFIHDAQAYNPGLSFWISPWSPPSWMKINHDYPVLSSKFNNQSPQLDYLLYSDNGACAKESVDSVAVDPDEMRLDDPAARGRLFPKRLATTDYFIQDPRYLSAYAEYFCRFIDEYAKEGIPVDMVMYQNEAYSYTPYPGCAWTADAIVRFNRDYLGPQLRRRHPDVKLYLGTFNTNRLRHVESLLADTALLAQIEGMGFQWEGRDILPDIRRQHPSLSYICSESECGWGSFDWGAAEHTFELINHYLGNGCNEYNIWNVALSGNGESPWGWKQNALVRVDTEKGTYTLTPEFHAVRHYAYALRPGSRVIGVVPDKGEYAGMPVLAALTPAGEYALMAGNFSDDTRSLTVKFGKKYINTVLPAHSFTTITVTP